MRVEKDGCEKRWVLMAIAARGAANARRKAWSKREEGDFRGGERRWKFKKKSQYAVLKESFGGGRELGDAAAF